MSEETIRDMIENCRDELVNGKYIQREHEMLDREEVLTKSRQLMFRLMDNLEKYYALNHAPNQKSIC